MQIFLSILGAVGILDSIIVSTFSNFNLGVIMPAIIGAPILAYGIFFDTLNSAPWVVLRNIGFGIYAAFALLFIVCTVLMITAPKLESGQKVDAVIVLGAAVRNDEATLTLKNRTHAAAAYLKANPKTVCVVSGGKGNDETRSEAEVMRELLLTDGISDERILIEDKATSTRENFLFSKAILDRRFGADGYTVGFATSDFHVYRAGLIARDAGLSAEGIACRSRWYVIPNFYLRETAAIVNYWLFKQDDDQ